MEIRPLTEDDWLPLGKIIAEAFSRGEQRPDSMTDVQRAEFALSKRFGAFVHGQLRAALTIIDIDVHWNGAVTRMGGIAGVCCAVTARGQGYVGALMRESLAVMRDSGQSISGLYPFSHAFYRKFGWETVVFGTRFTLPTTTIPAYAERYDVRTFTDREALETIKPIYDRFAPRYQGIATRGNQTPAWWEGLVAPNDGRATYVHIYTNPVSGEAEGYLSFRFAGDGSPAEVGDFVTLTPGAHRGLLGTLHNYATQLATVTWRGPADDLLPLFVAENDVKTTIEPAYMGRVVDVAATLPAFAPGAAGAAVLSVHDSQAAWNDGCFEIVASDGKLHVTQSTAATQCEMDIQTLSLACWGTYSLAALRAAGRITVTNEAAFSFLATLFPTRIPYIADAF